jgi:hypothetical protein
LLIYAEADFSGVTPHKHGGSEGAHIKALRAMGADVPAQEAEMPEQLRYLFDLFKSIKFSRIPNEDGFSLVSRGSISYNEVDYYSKMTGLTLEMWEVDGLLSLDCIFERAIN